MATVAETRLFPPIMASYLPAKSIDIDTTNGFGITFDVNELNNITDILEIHVIITRQSDYSSLFNSELFPLGIYPIVNAEVQTALQNGVIHIPERLGGLSLTAPIIDITQLNFNEYYKVQLRFSSVACCTDEHDALLTGSELSIALLNESNMAQFSEWSSVSALRFIAPPTFELRGNVANNVLNPNAQTAQMITGNFLSLYGTYTKKGTHNIMGHTFDYSDDKEYLSSWTIDVYQIVEGQDELKITSGLQVVNYRGANIDQIQYDIPFYFMNNTNYKITLTITTANLYTTSFNYLVTADSSEHSWGDQTVLNEYASLDSVIGKVNISFETKTEQTVPVGGDLIIRRAERTDNFTRWEQIWHYHFNEPYQTDGNPIVFNDFTIESGQIYKYSIAYVTGGGTAYSIIEGPVLSIFDHAFLTGEGTQLCVKFNPNLTNMKVNVSDNSVNTVGGQYPIISRNGNMYYRSFTLSGTIAYEMDAEHQFATRSSIYGEWINVYGSYFVNRYINQYNDRITQREFRELVIAYLYSDQPKLFRSTPEGNILVRLTDINLTPNTQLGRMIYDFSCTATEIGDCSIDNYKLYKIQDFGE